MSNVDWFDDWNRLPPSGTDDAGWPLRDGPEPTQTMWRSRPVIADAKSIQRAMNDLWVTLVRTGAL